MISDCSFHPVQKLFHIEFLCLQVFEIASISLGSTYSNDQTTSRSNSTMHVLPLFKVSPFQQFRKASIAIFISLALITLVLSSLVGVASHLAFEPQTRQLSKTSTCHLSAFQFVSRGLEIGMCAWNVLTVTGEMWALLSNCSYVEQKILIFKYGLLFLPALFVSILFYTCSRKHNIVRTIILCNRLMFSQSLLLFFAASVPHMIIHLCKP